MSMNVIAVDSMGGDDAPEPEVGGAVAAVREGALRVILVGDETRLRDALKKAGGEGESRIEIRHATEVVDMGDNPGKVFRHKPDSSMRVAFDLVASGEASGVVSAGNSGAMLSHALFVLGRIPGVERPGIVTVFPTPHGPVTLCDMGANVEVKAGVLATFGILGAHFDRALHGRPKPRVGVLCNGSEASKGTELTRAASALLSQAAKSSDAQFEFIGYVEGNDLFRGAVDVVATDGFTGNIVLKVAEGVSEAMFSFVKRQLASSSRAKVGAALAKPALMELTRTLHYSEAGGAVLLGTKGLTMICHGRSSEVAIKNAIGSADRFVTSGLTADLGAAVERHHRVWQNADSK